MNTLKSIIQQTASSSSWRAVSVEIIDTLEKVVRDIDSIDPALLLVAPVVITYPDHHQECVDQFLKSSKWALVPILPGMGHTLIDLTLTGQRQAGLENQYRRMDLITINLVTTLTRMMRDCIESTVNRPGSPRYFCLDAVDWHLEVFRIGFPRYSFIIEVFEDPQAGSRRSVRVI